MTTAKYIRLSSEDDDLNHGGKLESDSIVNQRNLLNAFIRTMPELASGQVVEFCDDGWSGKNFERPGVQKLLTQVKQGQINCIVVKDLSRFGRDYLTVGNYISRIFPFLGVRFISVNDGLDSIRQSDMDSLETSFRTLFHDLYSRNLSQAVRKIKTFRAQQGEFLSPFAPFGYVKDPENKHRLVIDPLAAGFVRRIFQMAIEGFSSLQIAQIFNAESIPTPMLYKRAAGCSRTIWPCVNEDNFWTKNSVAKILRDERYYGKNVYGKRTRDVIGSTHTVKIRREDWICVDNTHEAIVTKKEYDRAQSTMKKFTEREGKPLPATRGKLRCGVCGHSLVKSHSKSPYYFCRTPLDTGSFSCAEVHIVKSDLEDILVEDLRRQAAAAVELSRIWEEKHRSERKDAVETARSLAALKDSQGKLTQEIKALYEAYALGEMDKAQYLAQKSAAMQQRDAMANQIAAMESHLENHGSDGTLRNQFVNRFKQYTDVQELTSDIIVDVLDEVYVYPGGRVKIIWNFRDELENLMLDMQEGQQNER